MQITVRFNGVLPNINELEGKGESSARALEVKQHNFKSNTSCSIYLKDDETHSFHHILVDIGNGVVQSMERGFSSLNAGSSSLSSLSSDSFLPEVLLITNSRDDRIADLPTLIEKITHSSKNLQIYCTTECYEQIDQKFSQLLSTISSSNSSSVVSNNQHNVSVNVIHPNNVFNIGSLSITPIQANLGSNGPAGSVIYILNKDNTKMIFGWDFLSLENIDEKILWNPDLLVLGALSYNPHPEIGMISVSDAYSLIRRWNAKESYVVNYSGLADLEDSKNQWFRGPTKPMTSDELQSLVDSSGPITSDENHYSFSIIVATEGMIWQPKIQSLASTIYGDDNNKVGNELLIEGIENYVLKFEHNSVNDDLKIMVEDRINRRDLSFVRPRKDYNNDNIVYAEAMKGGMMTRGPELRMEVLNAHQQSSESQEDSPAIVRIHAHKGKKDVYRNDVQINNSDALKLKKYLNENLTQSA